MEYRTRGVFDSMVWVLLNALQLVGILGIAWNLFKPEGWLLLLLELVELNRPTSYYYLGVGVLGMLASKSWLDSLGPNAASNFLAAGSSFAGSYFVLHLLPL